MHSEISLPLRPCPGLYQDGPDVAREVPASILDSPNAELTGGVFAVPSNLLMDAVSHPGACHTCGVVRTPFSLWLPLIGSRSGPVVSGRASHSLLIHRQRDGAMTAAYSRLAALPSTQLMDVVSHPGACHTCWVVRTPFSLWLLLIGSRSEPVVSGRASHSLLIHRHH